MTNLLSAFYGEPWAITEPKLREIEAVLLRHAEGTRLTDEQIRTAIAESSHTPQALGSQAFDLDAYEGLQSFEPSESGMFYRKGTVAYVPLHGSIISRAGFVQRMSGAVSPQAFEARVRAAASDPEIHTIVLDIDSPGGTVSGTMPAAEAVAAAAETKRVVAVAENLMASAAYWIGSAASEIVLGENARAGSIGVIMAHRDLTGKLADEGIQTTIIRVQDDKALGHPEEKLSSSALREMQGMVQEHYHVFVKAVARSRNLPEDEIAHEIGSRAYIASDAVNLGLADRIGTLAEILDTMTADQKLQPLSTMSDTKSQETPPDVSAEIQAIREELAAEREARVAAESARKEAESAREEAMALVRDQQQVIAEQREATLRADAEALVDAEIIGKGKALPSQREALLGFCQSGGSFDADRIALLSEQYKAIAPGAAAPVQGAGVEDGANRSAPEATGGYDIRHDLMQSLPRKYRGEIAA